MGVLFVLSWARVRRVSLGRESSDWGNLWGKLLYEFVMVALLWRCVCTMLECICVEFAVICCCVTVFRCVSMLVV